MSDESILDRHRIHAAISGARLPVADFEVRPGLTLRATYAHVFAPITVAFARPPSANSPHPGPWKTAGSGLTFDCEFEITLDHGVSFGGVDRLNTLWLCVALLRLRSKSVIRGSIVSNLSFSDAPSAEDRRFFPMEVAAHQWAWRQNPWSSLTEDDLEWLRTSFDHAVKLLEAVEFARAFHAFDGAQWQSSCEAAVITLCASVEALIRPGRRDMTKRLAKAAAVFVVDEPAIWPMLYENMTGLFEFRGRAAHAARQLPVEAWYAAQLAIRPVFVQCIERGVLPDCDALLGEWARQIQI